MPDYIYLTDRAGRIHVLDVNTPNKRDTWTRAVCGDPGDFNQILNPDTYFKAGEQRITCKLCRKKLRMIII